MSLIDTRLLEDGTLLDIEMTAKGNIFSMAMMEAISDALTSHESDTHLRLVVLRGRGGNFSFGASVEEHQRETAPTMLMVFHRFVRQLAGYPVPVAALVEGRCLGGAFEVALACHLVFATPNAKMGCPEIQLGVFPPVLAVLGPQRLGGALSDRLLLTGQTIDAAQAAACGLTAETLEPSEEQTAFEALLAWYGKNLRGKSAYSLRQAVVAMREGSQLMRALAGPLNRLEHHYAESLLTSHDGNEGVDAFLERRPPVWTDA